jgi:hypothetical protein
VAKCERCARSRRQVSIIFMLAVFTNAIIRSLADLPFETVKDALVVPSAIVILVALYQLAVHRPKR